jgi:SOS-response transcriptional repressor LexA
MAGARLIQQGERRRAQILRYIQRYHDEQGHAPSIAQIADAVGLASPGAVRRHLGLLKAEGKVTWTKGGHRSLRLVNDDGGNDGKDEEQT